MKLEKRTFIEEEKYEEIISFLDENAEKKLVERQIIDTYHSENDFRMIRTKEYVKLDLKTNVNNEENVVYISKKYEKDLIRMFFNLRMSIDLKRYRIRNKYLYDGFYITVDNNLKFGRIFRVSMIYKEETEKKAAEEKVMKLFDSLGIVDMGIEKFNDLYRKYRMDWSDLIKDINEEDFVRNSE